MATLKLGALLFKTLAKPVANSLKKQTAKSDLFRRFCIGLAQRSHRWEMQIKMRFLGYEEEYIRPLSESRAVELGSNFLGEFLIFSVGAAVIGYETYKSNVKAKDRANFVNDAIEDFNKHYEEYEQQRVNDASEIKELKSKLKDLIDLNKETLEIVKTFQTKSDSTSDNNINSNKIENMEQKISYLNEDRNDDKSITLIDKVKEKLKKPVN